MRQLLLDGAPRSREAGLPERVNLSAAVQRKLAENLHKALEVLVARDKIRLGIDLDEGADRTSRRNADQPFRSDSPGFFCGGRQALLSQPVDRRFDIAVAIAQRPFAIHHPRASLFAQ